MDAEGLDAYLEELKQQFLAAAQHEGEDDGKEQGGVSAADSEDLCEGGSV